MTPAPKMNDGKMARAYNAGMKISELMRATGKDYAEVLQTLEDAGALLRTGGHARPIRGR